MTNPNVHLTEPLPADANITQEPLRAALQRLMPVFNRAVKDLVFTADKAGEVAADMQTLNAALSHGNPTDRSPGGDERHGSDRLGF